MNSIVCPLVGSYFRPPAPSLLKVLPAGTTLALVREPDNEYDPNAIALRVRSEHIPEAQHATLTDLLASQGMELEEVLSVPSWHLGYIPRAKALELRNAVLPEGAKLAFDATGKPTVAFATKE